MSAVPVTVALEDGGSPGAFSWGAPDRLVNVPNLRIEAVSGTSPGAMNAVPPLRFAGPQGAWRLAQRCRGQVARNAS